MPLYRTYKQDNLLVGVWKVDESADELCAMFDNFSLYESAYSKFTSEKRKQEWQAGFDYLKSRGLNVYTPKGDHLYNTLLIDTNNHCPLEAIKNLADNHGIYVGNKTACANEINKKTGEVKVIKHLHGGAASKDLKPYDNSIRISFIEPGSLNKGALKAIADEISKAVEDDE